MAVLDPVPLVVEDWSEGEFEEFDAPYWPHDIPKTGSRRVPFGRRILIEREDFAPVPPPGFKRLAPGRSERLRYGPVVTCTGHDNDERGRVTAIRCAMVPGSIGANPDGVKISATIHWVS